MSAAHAHAEGEEHHHEGRSVLFYTLLALFLGFITFVELGPLFEWFNLPIPALLALSVFKFFCVVGYFMHLIDDAPIYTRVFAAPMIGGTLMVLVLMTLFHTFSPSPGVDSFAVKERHWNIYNKECSSWLYSSVSNKAYCASPALDDARVAMHWRGAGAGGGQPAPESLSGKSEAEVKDMLMARGESMYNANCSSCHKEDGKGVAGAYPPLAGSDYAGFKDPAGHAKIVLNGLQGEIVVNGQTYNGVMSAFDGLNDYNIAAILTYERLSWGNNEGVVMPDVVASQR